MTVLLPGTGMAESPAAAKTEERMALVGSMTNMTLSILQDQKKSFAEREEIMERGISNMVDIDWIARFALGNAWRSASHDQRNHYTRLYHTYLTRMYLSTFAQDAKRKVSDMKILGIADAEEDRFSVRTEVQLSNAQYLKVNYLVRDEKDSHQIIDITVEGISLIDTHRKEFSEIAANSGVDGVIHTLEQRVNSDKPPVYLSRIM